MHTYYILIMIIMHMEVNDTVEVNITMITKTSVNAHRI